MQITVISDTHTMHDKVVLAGGDILIHCGDLTWLGQPWEVRSAMRWLSKQAYRYKIFIAGNHDFGFEPVGVGRETTQVIKRQAFAFRRMKVVKGLEANYKRWANKYDLIYLFHEAINIEGINFFGSPWNPYYYDWAFQYHRFTDQATALWNQIPDNTDILITHTPPLGQLDRNLHGESVGCQALAHALARVAPKYHLFGHIHEGYGVKESEAITFINAAICNRRYEPLNAPISFEYKLTH